MPSYIVKLKAGVLFCLANEDRSLLAKEEKTLDLFNFEQLKVLVLWFWLVTVAFFSSFDIIYAPPYFYGAYIARRNTQL